MLVEIEDMSERVTPGSRNHGTSGLSTDEVGDTLDTEMCGQVSLTPVSFQ